MVSCSNCNKDVSVDWDYCFYCGTDLKQVLKAAQEVLEAAQEIGRTFAYDQLFELLKLEANRTALLDSKATTYSGLLGIAVTILTAFGGVISIRGLEIKAQLPSSSPLPPAPLIIIYSLYASTVFLLIIAAIYAFKAYNLGYVKSSKEIEQLDSQISNLEEQIVGCANKDNKERLQNKLITLKMEKLRLLSAISVTDVKAPQVKNDPHKKDCYQSVNWDFLADNCDRKLVETKKVLIQQLREVITNNYNVNNKKSDKINSAHRATLSGIIFLLLLIISAQSQKLVKNEFLKIYSFD
jgi:hypothetical protein